MRLTIIALLALTACTPSNVELVSQTPTAATYRVGLSAPLQEVENQATAFCAAKGAVPRLAGVGPDTDVMKMSFYRQRRYECVTR